MSIVVRTGPQPANAADEESAPLLVSIHASQDRNQQQQRRRRDVDDHFRMAGLFFWRVGALYGASAVALGAFGAHGLKKHISDEHKLANWATAAQYQLAHSVAVLVARGNPVAATFFTAGMTLFSGSLYALTLDTERFRWLGPVTPVGGSLLILGWLVLAFSRAPVRL